VGYVPTDWGAAVLDALVLSQEPWKGSHYYGRYGQVPKELEVGGRTFDVSRFSQVKRGPGQRGVLIAVVNPDGDAAWRVELVTQSQLHPDPVAERERRAVAREAERVRVAAADARRNTGLALMESLEPVLGVRLFWDHRSESGLVKINVDDLAALAVRAGHDIPQPGV